MIRTTTRTDRYVTATVERSQSGYCILHHCRKVVDTNDDVTATCTTLDPSPEITTPLPYGPHRPTRTVLLAPRLRLDTPPACAPPESLIPHPALPVTTNSHARHSRFHATIPALSPPHSIPRHRRTEAQRAGKLHGPAPTPITSHCVPQNNRNPAVCPL